MRGHQATKSLESLTEEGFAITSFEKRRIIRENQRIFVAVKLQGQDRESVAVRYRTTRNNVYQIVARVVRALREEGLKIDWEMYDQAV